MRVAATGSGHIVQFPGFGEFAVSPSAIVCHPRTGIPLETVRHLLLDQLLPALLGSRRLVLRQRRHRCPGSRLPRQPRRQIRAGGGLVRSGASLVTDARLVIECRTDVPRAVPSYPGLRLWPDSQRLVGAWRVRRTQVAHYTRKQRWYGAAVPYSERPLPLDALYLVARGRSRAGIHLMSARQSIMALVRYSMMLDANDQSTVRFGFELASRLVEQIPVRRLVIPPGARALHEMCRALNIVTASRRT